MNFDVLNDIKHDRLGIEVYTTTHCNLKCRGCSRFSNISKPHFYDLKTFEEDMKHLKSIGCKLSYLTMTGGEPLLHPELIDFIRIGYSYFPNSRLCILTNGMLFNKQKQEFYDILRELFVTVTYSKYRTDMINYDALLAICRENNINHYNINTSSKFYIKDDMYKSVFTICPLTIKSNGRSIVYKKGICNMDCTCIFNGKIFQCGTACNSFILNEKYNIDVTSDTDYMNISETRNRFDIYDFLLQPTKMCDHCFNVDCKNTIWSKISDLDIENRESIIKNDAINTEV